MIEEAEGAESCEKIHQCAWEVREGWGLHVAMASSQCTSSISGTYYWFCIMYKSRFSCSLGSLARLSTLL